MTTLTDLAIRKLSIPSSGRRIYWDDGLGLRISSSGARNFVIKHKTTFKTIGRYPDISLKEARQEAMRLKVHGSSKRRTERLTGAVAAFLEDCQTRLRPKTVASYRTVLQHAPDILLSEANRKTVPATTAHEIKAYKTLFNWCQAEDLTDRNPFSHLTVQFHSRERVLTDHEISTIWSYDYPPYSHIIKLLILTGQRRGDIWQLQPGWIDGDLVTIPAAHYKTNRSHTFPLSPLAQQYISFAPFSFNGWSKSKVRMDQHTGVTNYRLHDLRRTFITTMASLGVRIEVTERLVGHKETTGGIVGVYNRYNYLPEMRDALTVYERHLRGIIDAR